MANSRIRLARWSVFGFVALATVTTAAQAGGRRDKERGNQAQAAAQAVKIVTAADAPRPPETPLRKSQQPDLKSTAAKREITTLETRIFQMEKPSATLWSFIDDEKGEHQREIGYVAKQISELDELLHALEAADPAWSRLPEYRTRIAYLQKAHAAQKAHYGTLAGAREAAIAGAEKQAAADWAAKHVVDDGMPTKVHKGAAGKILLANGNIAASDEDSAKFVTSVNVDAPLFGRAYLAESPWNTMHGAKIDCGDAPEKIQQFSLITYYSVNGAEDRKLEEQFVDKAAFQRQTTFALTNAGSLSAGGDYQNADEGKAPFAWLTGVVGGFKAGSNTVKMTMYAWCYDAGSRGGKPVASAEVTVVATEPTLTAVAQRGRFKLTASTYTGAELSNYRGQIAKAYAANATALDVRVQSQWTIVRNSFGVILERTANAVTVLRTKAAPWRCEMVSIVMREVFDGRQYGPHTKLEQVGVRPFVCNVK